MKEVRLTRKELYEKVWETPLRTLAREWGISDVGLAKICKRHSIPRPPQGYWARVPAGRKAAKKPLPKVEESDQVAICLYERSGNETLPERLDMKKYAVLLSREEIYDKVWAVPIQTLADELQVNEASLTELCKERDIPMPDSEYWAAKESGREVKPIPLFYSGEDVLFSYPPPSAARDQIQAEENLLRQAEEMMGAEENARESIPVDDVLTDPHPLVARTEKALRAAKVGEDGLLRPSARNILSVAVGPDSVDRAMQIMDALLKALNQRGMKVTVIVPEPVMPDRNRYSYPGAPEPQPIQPPSLTCVSLFGESVEFQLSESTNRREKKADPKAARKQYGSYYRPQPDYEVFPSGQFSFSIERESYSSIRTTWKEGVRQKVENCLRKIIVSLIERALEKRSRRLSHEKSEGDRKVDQRRRQRRDWEEGKEKSRLEKVNREMVRRHKAREIREYVAAVQATAVDRGIAVKPNSGLDLWIRWALRKADQIDPLTRKLPEYSDPGKEPPYPYWAPRGGANDSSPDWLLSAL